MNKIRRVVGIALYETRIMVFSSRFLVVSLISFVFMDMAMRQIREFASDYNLKIIPAVLPAYFSDIIYCNIAFLLLVLLYSDIPMKGAGQRFLVIRGKSMEGCCAGHILSVGIMGILFVAEQILFSFVTALPNVELGGWGKVWGSIASGKAYELGYSIAVYPSDAVLRMYTPWQAIGISAVIFFLTGCIYALIEYLLNGLSRGKVGTIALSVWSVGWIFLQNSMIPSARRLLKYSPQSWNDLSRMELSDSLERIGFMTAGVLVLSVIVLLVVKYRKIELVR